MGRVCLRALIPVGFMPDLAAAQRSTFRVIICSAHGITTIKVDETGKILPRKADVKGGQQCAFSVLETLLLPSHDGGIAVADQRVVAAGISPLAPPVRRTSTRLLRSAYTLLNVGTHRPRDCAQSQTRCWRD